MTNGLRQAPPTGKVFCFTLPRSSCKTDHGRDDFEGREENPLLSNPGTQLSAAIRLVEQASNLAVEGVLLPVCHSDARLCLQQDGYCLLRLLLDAQKELRESQNQAEEGGEKWVN